MSAISCSVFRQINANISNTGKKITQQILDKVDSLEKDIRATGRDDIANEMRQDYQLILYNDKVVAERWKGLAKRLKPSALDRIINKTRATKMDQLAGWLHELACKL